eukprot:TRINITY_DN81401_c0_g1_i1.p1 TRINITY_DN81401_c0_g1~~TRINITY_DN81401_c0_g1_i1.p1  ORF type:complete len:491 (+),score=43.83 TRINITY_DN81401_c0_g1_i1:80-1552(+)
MMDRTVQSHDPIAPSYLAGRLSQRAARTTAAVGSGGFPGEYGPVPGSALDDSDAPSPPPQSMQLSRPPQMRTLQDAKDILKERTRRWEQECMQCNSKADYVYAKMQYLTDIIHIQQEALQNRDSMGLDREKVALLEHSVQLSQLEITSLKSLLADASVGRGPAAGPGAPEQRQGVGPTGPGNKTPPPGRYSANRGDQDRARINEEQSRRPVQPPAQRGDRNWDREREWVQDWDKDRDFRERDQLPTAPQPAPFQMPLRNEPLNYGRTFYGNTIPPQGGQHSPTEVPDFPPDLSIRPAARRSLSLPSAASLPGPNTPQNNGRTPPFYVKGIGSTAQLAGIRTNSPAGHTPLKPGGRQQPNISDLRQGPSAMNSSGRPGPSSAVLSHTGVAFPDDEAILGDSADAADNSAVYALTDEIMALRFAQQPVPAARVSSVLQNLLKLVEASNLEKQELRRRALQYKQLYLQEVEKRGRADPQSHQERYDGLSRPFH